MIESPLILEHEAEAKRQPVEKDSLKEAQRPGADSGLAESRLELEYLPWGGEETDPEDRCLILATCGWVELEYAAMRRGCGLLDQLNRGTLSIQGQDRRGFIDCMITQDLKLLTSGSACRSFMTDRKGRVIADLQLLELPEEILIDLDIHQLKSVQSLLEGLVFTEDVVIEDATTRWYRLGIHGPETAAIIDAFGTMPESHLEVHTVDVSGVPVHAVRNDAVAAPGCDLFVSRDDVVQTWSSIRKQASIRGVRARTVGWYAYNTARIEGGSPIFNVDFGTSNLPHETSLVEERVSFTKGCYPGQEVVARMQHLGQPKQRLRGLKIQSEQLPVAGTQIFASEDGDLAEPVGVVTSSTISPLAGAAPIAFAMLKKRVAAEGTTVRMHAEGDVCEAIVGDLDLNGMARKG